MSIFLDGLHWIHSVHNVNSNLHHEEESSSLETACPDRVSLCRKDKNNTKMDDEDMDGPIYRPSGIILTVIGPQESHDLCVIPQPAQKKDRCKWSDQPNGVSNTSMGPKFYPEAGPRGAGKANDLSYVRSRKWFHCRTRLKEMKE